MSKLSNYGFKRLSLIRLNSSQPRLFKIRFGRDERSYLIRLDIINKTYILIIRRNGLISYLQREAE